MTRVSADVSGERASVGAAALVERLALRPAEAARALGISERTLRALLPRLPHVRLAGVVLIPKRELEQWLREQALGQAAERVAERAADRKELIANVVREGFAKLVPEKSR